MRTGLGWGVMWLWCSFGIEQWQRGLVAIELTFWDFRTYWYRMHTLHGTPCLVYLIDGGSLLDGVDYMGTPSALQQ